MLPIAPSLIAAGLLWASPHMPAELATLFEPPPPPLPPPAKKLGVTHRARPPRVG